VRTYAMVFCSIWADPDFRALSPAGQWLYLNRLTSPSLTHVGSADWRPKRIAALADGADVQFVEAAGAELAATRFVVIDDETEEILLRSFVRWDGLMKMPNMAIAMAKAHAALASEQLRQVAVHELRRLRLDQPDLTGWDHRDSKDQVAAILEQPAVDARDLTPWTPDWMDAWEGFAEALRNGPANPSGNPSAKGSGNPSGKGSDRGSGKGSVNGSSKGSANPCLTPSPSPYPATATSSPSAFADANAARPSRAGDHETPSEASDAPEPGSTTTSANLLLAGWIDTLDERPASRVKGQLAREIKTLLVDGFSEEHVTLGLTEWQMRGVHPSVLASIVQSIRDRGGRPAAASGAQGAPLPGAGVWDRGPVRAAGRPA